VWQTSGTFCRKSSGCSRSVETPPSPAAQCTLSELPPSPGKPIRPALALRLPLRTGYYTPRAPRPLNRTSPPPVFSSFSDVERSDIHPSLAVDPRPFFAADPSPPTDLGDVGIFLFVFFQTIPRSSRFARGPTKRAPFSPDQEFFPA